MSIIDSSIKYHDTLCPDVWDESNAMKQEVRERLIEIAQLFVDYLDIEAFNIEDIVLAGSMANYNYTSFSDFDLHVVTKYSDLECDNLAEKFYKAKKQIWNDAHDITIHGHDVELYVEDTEEPPNSLGIYSILHDQWVSEPKHTPPIFDYNSVAVKAKHLADEMSEMLRSDPTPADFKQFLEKLVHFRKAGLEEGGEFSTENLAFKVLRNSGQLDRLREAYNTVIDKNLTIK